MPPAAKLLIVPVDNSSPFAVAVRYNLWRLGMPDRQIFATILWDADHFAKAAIWAARGDANYLLVQDAEGVMDEAMGSLGIPRINHELVLLRWQDGAWQKVKSWSVDLFESMQESSPSELAYEEGDGDTEDHSEAQTDNASRSDHTTANGL